MKCREALLNDIKSLLTLGSGAKNNTRTFSEGQYRVESACTSARTKIVEHHAPLYQPLNHFTRLWSMKKT